MNQFFKVIGYVFALLFAVGAAVQYNDPDSMLWILIYLLAALISLVFALGRLKAAIPLVFGGFALVGFLFLYPTDFQGFDLNDGDIETVELGREAFGLLIIALVLLIFGFRLKRKS